MAIFASATANRKESEHHPSFNLIMAFSLAATAIVAARGLAQEISERLGPNETKAAEIALRLRHIELDENHHGPMAAQMLAELCGDEVQRWNEAAEAAILALSARLTLWNSVLSEVARRNADAAPATPLSGDDLDQEFGSKEFAGGQNGGPSRNLSFSA